MLLLLVGLSFSTRGYRVRALQEYQEDSSQMLRQQVGVLRARAAKRDQQMQAMRKQASMIRSSLEHGSEKALSVQ